MNTRKFLAAFSLPAFLILNIATCVSVVNAQTLVNIAPNTGEKYGITIWGAWGWQNPAQNPIGGYGVNIKYGSVGLGTLKTWIESTEVPCDACETKTKRSYDTNVSHAIRVSFGVGYVSYYDFQSPLTGLEFESQLDMSAPYGGVYLSVPLYFVDNEIGGKKNRENASINLIVGYTASIFSAEGVLGRYIGSPLGANGDADFPLTLKIPTTINHNLNVGLSFGKHLFIEFDMNMLKARSVLYSPINQTLPKDLLQDELGGTLDLSFMGVKVGYSFNF